MSRRGGSTTGLLVVLALVGGLSVTAVVVSPRIILAASGPGTAADAPRTSQHQAVLEALAAVVRQSDRVLAVHDRGTTPYLELVLWMNDDRNPGVVDADEVGVLSHSRMMRSITFFGVTAERGRRAASLPADPTITDPRFCNAWRARVDVTPRVVAADVSDMHVEVAKSDSVGSAALRISLTWAADSSDGADEGSVFVDVEARDGAKE